MREQAFALVAVLLIALVGVSAISSQYDNSVRGGGEPVEIDNETFNADLDTPVNLSESNVSDRVYFETSEVRVFDGVNLSGDDYRWNEEGFGRINISSTSSVTDGEKLNITYGYYEPRGNQQTAKLVGTLPAQIGEALAFFFVMFVLFAAVMRLR